MRMGNLSALSLLTAVHGCGIPLQDTRAKFSGLEKEFRALRDDMRRKDDLVRKVR